MASSFANLQVASDGKCYYSWQQIEETLAQVAPALHNFAPDVIIAIGGGGFIPARVLRSSIQVHHCSCE